MTTYLIILSGILLIILLIGLYAIISGPSQTDKMLACQLFGTVGVAILMLLAVVQEQHSLLNTALILALLAPLTLIAFVKLAEKLK